MDPSLGKKKFEYKNPKEMREKIRMNKKKKRNKNDKNEKKKKKTLPCKDMFVQNTKITLVFPFSLHISL